MSEYDVYSIQYSLCGLGRVHWYQCGGVGWGGKGVGLGVGRG